MSVQILNKASLSILFRQLHDVSKEIRQINSLTRPYIYAFDTILPI